MPHLGYNSSACCNSQQVKTVKNCPRSLVLDIARILRLPVKVTIATSILVEKSHKQMGFFHKNKFY